MEIQHYRKSTTTIWHTLSICELMPEIPARTFKEVFIIWNYFNSLEQFLLMKENKYIRAFKYHLKLHKL